MHVNPSPLDESVATIKLRPAPLRDEFRRDLIDLDGPSGRTHTGVRNLVREDFCASSPDLVQLPATSTRESIPLLVFPGERIIDAGGRLAWASPSAYVIQDRELRLFRDVSLCAGRSPFQLSLTALQDALTSETGFEPVAKAHLKALHNGELVRRLLATRQTVWDHHVRRLQINPAKCRHVEMIVRRSRYLVELTHVVDSLLADMRDSEWALVKRFLAPLNEYTVRRTLRRPTALERQRNRYQALETYPFLESIWHTDDLTESPVANSLLSTLSPREVKTIRRIIDEGRPLSALLARELSLEPWMIEHLRRHWSQYIIFDRTHYPDHSWDLRAMLSLWTPETAPRTLDELHRIHALTYRHYDNATLLYRSINFPLCREDRRTLRQLVSSGSDCERMLGYLAFIHSLNHWILNELGRDCIKDLPRLLGAKNVSDWQVCARRWHAINAELKRRAGDGEASRDSSAPLEWPALLTRVETVGDFTFHSLHTYEDLKAESQAMQNCASTYLTRCALGESHMIHMALGGTPVGTVEVRKAMYGDNTKILLAHAEAARHAPLIAAAEQALYQFLDACNDGGIALNSEAVMPSSLRMELLAPLLKSQCLDYATWEKANIGHDYFTLHAYVSGSDVFDRYRAALELEKDANESLYILALRAVRQCRRSVVGYGNISVAR